MIIRGNTIGTPLKPEKNLVKATDLTDEEKAQVRKNIGAVASVNNVKPDENGNVQIETGGERPPLVVTYANHDRANSDSPTIYNHIINGGTAVFYDGNAYLTLQSCSSGYAVFGKMDVDDRNYVIVVGEQGEVYHNNNKLVSIDYFDKTIGDISSALDSIIAMQEELIGGDS